MAAALDFLPMYILYTLSKIQGPSKVVTVRVCPRAPIFMRETYISLSSLFARGRIMKFVPINLNQFYNKSNRSLSPIKDHVDFDKKIKELPFLTFGGYGENRKDMFKETYLAKHNSFIHLGVDINLSKGHGVFAPFQMEVLDIFKDTDTELGWGGRVIAKKVNTSGPFIIFAHLNPMSLTSETKLEKGERIGTIATWPENGNTFEHLHLQLTRSDDFASLDGYGHESDLSKNPCPLTTPFHTC